MSDDAHIPEKGGRLCPRSGEAVDALVDKGFELDGLDADHRARCETLHSLLAKLSSGPLPCCCADESVQRASARIALHKRLADTRYELCDADADALELLVANGWDAKKVPSAVRPRAERQAQLLALLDAAPSVATISTDHIVRAAMSRIETDASGQARRMRLHEPAAPQRRSLRLTDLGGIAAVLIVAVSVAWPALANVRQRAQQSACLGGLGAVGSAMGAYGNDSRGALPMATASLAGTKWWNVGTPEQSNSANLYTLVSAGHLLRPQQLACCGNPAAKGCGVTEECADWHSFEDVSYSYQNLFAHERPRLDGPGGSFVVLADRNPAVLRAFRGERVIFIDENSPNHRGSGQNVLMSDGHALWTVTPVVGGDNIWLPRSFERLIEKVAGGRPPSKSDPLKGVEEPDKADAFLCP